MESPQIPEVLSTELLGDVSAIALGQSPQGESQFLILLPPGIELRGVLYRWTMVTRLSPTQLVGHETFSDYLNAPGPQESTSGISHVANTDSFNQHPIAVNQFTEHDTIIASNTIANPVFANPLPALPAGRHNVNYIYSPTTNGYNIDWMRDGSQDSAAAEGLFSGTMGQGNMGTHMGWQDAEPIFNTGTPVGSQQPLHKFQTPPAIPQDMSFALEFPGYGIRSEEPAISAAPAFVNAQMSHLGTYGSCVATGSRHA
ncbi:hypothetical protein BDZ91DRAFT_846725 [Kalaharituber pfeilii]|nr:hypothetical protein BDZ91DRAFT_846725 [Kalaharituber pfeilii]